VVGKVLSAVRLVADFPIARKKGRLPLWGFELAVQKTTIDIVPPTGGYWGLWGKAFATSQALKGIGAIVTIAVAGAATSSALHNGGVPALGNTTKGRTGVAATIASAGPALAAWTFIGANQLGYLDGINKGETRSSGQIMTDSWTHTRELPGEIKAKLASYFGWLPVVA